MNTEQRIEQAVKFARAVTMVNECSEYQAAVAVSGKSLSVSVYGNESNPEYSFFEHLFMLGHDGEQEKLDQAYKELIWHMEVEAGAYED